LVVQELDTFPDKTQPDKKFVKEPVVSQNVHPGKYPDKKIGPKRDDDKEQEDGLIPAPGHIISAGKGDEDGQRRGHYGSKEGPDGDKYETGIPQTPIGGKGKHRLHPAVEALFKETVEYNNDEGGKEKNGEPNGQGP
jgi:hypothetical protein